MVFPHTKAIANWKFLLVIGRRRKIEHSKLILQSQIYLQRALAQLQKEYDPPDQDNMSYRHSRYQEMQNTARGV